MSDNRLGLRDDLISRHTWIHSMTQSEITAVRTVGRYLRSLASGGGTTRAALAFAGSRDWADAATISSQLKAAVGGHQTGGVPAVGPIDALFTETLRARTIVGRLTQARRAPFRIRLIGITDGATAYWVGEGQAKPLSRAAFVQGVQFERRKVVGMTVATQELITGASGLADMAIGGDLVAAVALATDTAFVDRDSAGTAATPAGITNGQPVVALGAATVAGLDAAIEDAIGLLTAVGNDLSSCVWITSAATAGWIARLRGTGGAPAYPGITALGGTLLGLPVITSDAAVGAGSPADGELILIDAAGVVIADEGEATLSSTQEASLLMTDDANANMNSTTPTGSSMVSMFQTNSVCFRAERYLNWARRRDTIAATNVGLPA